MSMLEYQAPLDDCEFLLFDTFPARAHWREVAEAQGLDDSLVRAILQEAGRVAAEVLTPTNQSGDEQGCRWSEAAVYTPAGFKEGYREIANGGWLGLAGNPAFSGQGMPKMLGCLVEEMFWAANPSLYLYGTLSVGAAICIDRHGTSEQKSTYLPKLYAGTWSGAMALTESHAGSDLGLLKTKAEPRGDGSYSITGSKIFITSGEHDLAENIVHLVLARTPDAPGGSRGISLFIVPKFLPDDMGNLGARNGMASGSIESKMGIKGSATNVMNYDGAVGYLVGDVNEGLACMFTMMNYERLSVGLQGLGAGELAYQQASRYARDRLQGRSPEGAKSPHEPADSLLVHPDVRRMLLTVRSLTEAGRAFAVFVGMQLDRSKYANDAQADALAQLLTPIAKAFLSDRGFECAVLAQQVFGGHGYLKDWGVEQIVRDVRIAQIYEGTNGIQAHDLLGRKVLRDGGAVLSQLLARIQEEPVDEALRPALAEAIDRVRTVTDSLLARAQGDVNLPGAVATDYLDLLGYTLYAWLWARMVAVLESADHGKGADFAAGKRACAAFYFARILPRTLGLARSIEADSQAVMGFPEAAF